MAKDGQKEKKIRLGMSNLKKSKKLDRVNHVTDACNAKGFFAQVPHCIYEMGLTWQEREVWMYFNRIPRWEHPTVEQIHKLLQMRKDAVLTAIEKLCSLNMLVVEGERKNRKFHIPHPMYWKHDIPREQYKTEDAKPLDIGSDVFTGVAVKRSVGNVPSGTNEKRSVGNVQTFRRERSNVPSGTNDSQQTYDNQRTEPPLKNNQEYSIKLKPGGGHRLPTQPGDVKWSLEDLEGAMRGLYHVKTPKSVIKPVIKAMLKVEPDREKVMEVIQAKGRKLQGLLTWKLGDCDAWVRILSAEEDVPEEVEYQVEDRDGWVNPAVGLDLPVH